MVKINAALTLLWCFAGERRLLVEGGVILLVCMLEPISAA